MADRARHSANGLTPQARMESNLVHGRRLVRARLRLGACLGDIVGIAPRGCGKGDDWRQVGLPQL